ncbi:MAG: hypothetical protein PVS3B3_07550 [Ktedonobacteraceae bacterium]
MALSILLALGLGIIALTFVLTPIFRTVQARPISEVTHTREDVVPVVSNAMTEREQSARSALQEIELDYQLGNISEEDYNTLRERYMRSALVALKSRHDNGQDVSIVETTYDRDKELDDLIEEQLRTLKEQGTDATK